MYLWIHYFAHIKGWKINWFETSLKWHQCDNTYIKIIWKKINFSENRTHSKWLICNFHRDFPAADNRCCSLCSFLPFSWVYPHDCLLFEDQIENKAVYHQMNSIVLIIHGLFPLVEFTVHTLAHFRTSQYGKNKKMTLSCCYFYFYSYE